MKPQLLAIVLVTALAGSAGCDRSNPVPPPSPISPTPAAPAPGPAQVVSIRISGNVSLTAIGATSALTASAVMSDGSTRDVTTTAVWSSSDSSIITVSPAGVVTAVRFGVSYIAAKSGTKGASLNVQATPPGTFVVFGRVREPGSSGLPGVLVREDISGASVQSAADGVYSLAGLPGARLTFEKDGYERVAAEARSATYLDVAMQRVVRIAAGASVNVGLAPHDVSYDLPGGLRCNPCKMIRVVTAQAGRLQLLATWKEPRAAINLWVNGRLFEGTGPGGPLEASAEVAIDGRGELLAYVGLKNAADFHAPFTLTTVVVK